MGEKLCILGIESSCDDTAAAVVCHRPGEVADILSSVVFSQTDLHASFGGVVPEIAARAHAEKLDIAVEKALSEAEIQLSDLDAVAVTAGPGLIGGVFSGVMCAKGIAAGAGLPLIGVNHLAGHALTPRLTDQIEFPYLTLLVSGGHCQFLTVNSETEFERLGGTIDDAPGEAFDKVARMLGLPQPGGPAVESAALNGDPTRFQFPRPLQNRDGCNMSFSGLKTAVLRQRDQIIESNGGLSEKDQTDLCAGFQAAICDVFVHKTTVALASFARDHSSQTTLSLTGGVAANMAIRRALETVCAEFGANFVAPPSKFCTDNGAMIAWAGIELFRQGIHDDLSLGARPRWPLDNKRPAILGSGKKGAKA